MNYPDGKPQEQEHVRSTSIWGTCYIGYQQLSSYLNNTTKFRTLLHKR